MPLAYGLPDVSCAGCGNEEVVYFTKEEGSGWKVFVECSGCGQDYGRAGLVKLADVGDRDEVDARAREMAQQRVAAAVVV